MVSALEILLGDKETLGRYLMHVAEFMAVANDVYAQQDTLFQDMIYEAKDTPFGIEQGYGSHLQLSDLKDPEKFKIFNTDKKDPKKFGFSGGSNLEDIMQKVLIGDEEATKYFTNYEVLALATSSGTSGKHKLTIVTEKRNEILEKEGPVWFFLNVINATKASRGKTLFYCAPPYKERGIVDVINISGYQAINIAKFMVDAQSIPPKVWTIMDKEKREWEIAYNTIIHKNTKLVGCSSASVPYDKWMYIKKHRTSLIRRLRDKGHEERADELGELDVNFYVDDVFPELTQLVTIKSDVNKDDIKKYSSLFRDFSKIKISESGVNLTECRATYGVPGEGNQGVPAANGYVYLFNEIVGGKVKEKRLPINELELGKKYSMMSFSYDMPFLWNTDDLFEVTGWYGDLPVLSHIGKHGYVNFLQEHVHIEDIKKSLTGFNLKNFFLKPYLNEEGKKGYNLMIELDKNMDEKALSRALWRVESYLQKNALTYYEVMHQHGSDSGTMATSRVQILEEDTILNHTQEMSSKNEQYKHKHVHDDFEFGNDFKILTTVEISPDIISRINESARKSHKNLIQ